MSTTTLGPRFLSLVVTLLMLLLLVIKIEGKYSNSILPPKEEVYENGTTTSNVDHRPITGCRSRPWICSQGEFPPRFMCCENSCVDVSTDASNCGLCGIRCMNNWRCCNRLCVNINVNPLNCGRCGRVCPIGRLCLFGLCTFDQQASPPLLPPNLPDLNPPPPIIMD